MISVVMPAYNASIFIAEAIESILNQTSQEFELLIIDDGSIDDTIEIVNRYCGQDQRVRLIQIDHAGISHARNVGTQTSSYPWIAVMDADDIALPKRLEVQIAAAEARPNVVAWGTYAHHISSTGTLLSLQQQGPTMEEDYEQLIRCGEIPFIIHPTALIKKEILVEIGGYSSKFPLAVDFELFSRIIHRGSVLALPEPLLLYRVHEGSASMQKFFRQQFFARYIVARHQTQLAGTRLPEIEEFTQHEKDLPLISKLDQRLRLGGQFLYRKAGLHIAEKHYCRGAFCLSMAIVANPTYAVPRVWNQKLSPDARQTLKNYKT